MEEVKRYKKNFYQSMNIWHYSNYSSARRIVPYILSLFPKTKSVIEFGCGTGTWLKSFIDNGVSDILGIDGPWLDEEDLLIPDMNFKVCNLENEIDMGRKFDIAISLEVAEHIKPQSEERFILNLTKHSDIIIFSAAIPNQGGEYHVNEQWQSYWKERFDGMGYSCIDPIRGVFAKNQEVLPHYKQNILVYIRKTAISEYPEIQKFVGIPFMADLVVPEMSLYSEPYGGKFLLYQQKLLCRCILKRLLGKKRNENNKGKNGR